MADPKINDEMSSYNLKLSHHEKRSIAWKVIVACIIFVLVMMFGGLLHYLLDITDPFLSIWFIASSFIAVGTFGIGYIIRDKLPSRMGKKCKRFYYMGKEFGIWHWTRAQIFLADIFLVCLAGAAFGWGIMHTMPLLLKGTGLMNTVPLFYIPILWVPFWMEIVLEAGMVAIVIIGFIYEARTWILSKSNDFCYFEGIKTKSDSMLYDCDPGDTECLLNRRFG